MMQIKLTRDEARTVRERWLNYIIQVADMKVRDTKNNIDENLNARVIKSVVEDLKKKYDKKLLNNGNRMYFKFNDAEGIVLYKFLMQIPVPADQYWFFLLRNKITDSLHKQISEPYL